MPKVTKGPLAHLDPQGLQALLEAEEPKALGSQIRSPTSVQGRRVSYPMMIPWWGELMRKSMSAILHKQNP